MSRYWTQDKCDKADMPFNIIIGGRGTGKTFTCLNNAYLNVTDNSHFALMRRTEVEISSIADEKYNPYKKINSLKGYNVQARYIQKNSVGEFYETDTNGEDRFLGYATALSTFGKLRGADLSDVTELVFDEFIKTKSAHVIKDEADLFFNAYETINRNRELEGQPPLKAYLLSNATTLNSPILEELNLINVIERMKMKGQVAFTDKDRGIHIELLDKIQVSKEKANTALYRLTKGTAYSDHALNNEFAYDSFENIAKVNLTEYIAWIHLDSLYIYRHKSRLEYYVCQSPNKCEFEYTGDAIPLFKRHFGVRFYQLLVGGYVKFANFAVKQKIFGYY